MKFPDKDHPRGCGFTERELNTRVGQLRKYVPATEPPKPEYLHSHEQFLKQMRVPLYRINLDRGLKDFNLQKHINRIHTAVSMRCREFTRAIPNLPGTYDMACIEVITRQYGPVDVCLSLRDLYCRGIYLRKSKIFYENIDAGCKNNPTTTGFWVQGSLPLGSGGHKYSDLGIRFPLELTSQKFVKGYISMASLGTEHKDLNGALYGMGIFALLFIEPVRQLVVQTFLRPHKIKNENRNEEKYGTLTDGGDVMKAIRDWGKDCLIAQGLEKETDHILREDPAVDYGKRAAALVNIKTINYPGILYYF